MSVAGHLPEVEVLETKEQLSIAVKEVSVSASSGCSIKRSFCDIDLIMSETGRTSITTASRYVTWGELLDTTELDEFESCSISKLLLKLLNQLRVNEFLGLDEGLIVAFFAINEDLVVVRVGSVDQDCDVVFWALFFFAEAVSGDSNVVELGLGHDGYTGVDVDTKRNISNFALKLLEILFLDCKVSLTYSPCMATSGEVTQISLRRGMVDFLDYQW